MEIDSYPGANSEKPNVMPNRKALLSPKPLEPSQGGQGHLTKALNPTQYQGWWVWL